MKYFNALLLFCCSFSVLTAQTGPWQDVRPENIKLPQGTEVYLATAKYRPLQLSLASLKNDLQAAPMEGSGGKKVIITLPLPDGKWERFAVEESPVMAPGLAARYPSIKAYAGRSLDQTGLQVRFDLAGDEFHASIFTPEGTIYIDPYASVNTPYFVSYFTKDLKITDADLQQASCALSAKELMELEERRPRNTTPAMFLRSGTRTLLTYRLAVACTGEYAQRNGVSKERVLASMNTALNRVNQIFIRETAVKLQLIEKNDTLIFQDPATDPYADAGDGRALLQGNTAVLNARIGAANYDIGHVFTLSCRDGIGGIAAPFSVCNNNNKGNGVTCFSSNNISFIAAQIMAHEIGHQFSCGHSWSNCPESKDQFSSGNAYEPGSGSTIMSYAGTCAGNNVANQSDDYYNIGSLIDFIEFSRVGGGKGCATEVPTPNREPSLSVVSPNNVTIPLNTPFELRAQGSDPDSDPLTYCWEQFDLGPSSTLGSPIGNAPLFRSFPPDTSPSRTFPNLNDLVSNTVRATEVLPAYKRSLNFRCTVRDNHPQAGSAIWEGIKLEVTDQAGPFLVTAPNAGDETWRAGDNAIVTWDVAKTNLSPVNCQYVNIRMSVDGGFSYPFLLAQNAVNDGSERISVPNMMSENARIRIEAVGNVFFDISNRNFRITSAAKPTFSLGVAPYSLPLACQPKPVEFTINNTALGGFSQPVKLEILETLPQGASLSFSRNNLRAGESSVLRVNVGQILRGTFSLTLRASAAADTVLRTLTFTTVSTDFSDLKLLSPNDGQSGIQLSTVLKWKGAQAANGYDVELASSPRFSETIISRAAGIGRDTFAPRDILPDNSLFFWRVRPLNECGAASFSQPFTFHTSSTDCKRYSTDVAVNIPGRNNPTVESRLNITDAGLIRDVNIPNLNIEYSTVNQLRVSLVSPKGTEVVLYDADCSGLTDIMKVGFDDNAPGVLAAGTATCPPDDGIVFKPKSPLAALIGENIQGTWILRVQVKRSQAGTPGTVSAWNLEFCSTRATTNPTLSSTPVRALRGQSTNVISQNLNAQDNDTAADKLTYTLVEDPKQGRLRLGTTALAVGSKFTQADINANRLNFLANGNAADTDVFSFVIQDGTGGFLPLRSLAINIEGPTSLREIPLPFEVSLFPNPTRDVMQVKFGQSLPTDAVLRVYNLQGQLLQQAQVQKGANQHPIETEQWPNGAYFLQIRTNIGGMSLPFQVQH